MRACYILLLVAVAFLANFESTMAFGVSGLSKLTNVATPDTLQSADIVKTDGTTKRSFRSHNTELATADTTDGEERGFPGTEKIVSVLKNWADKDAKYVKMLQGGELKDLAVFKKLYSKKAIPYKLFTKMQLSKLSEAEKKNSEVYQKWAAYFDYWVDRNTGKIKP